METHSHAADKLKLKCIQSIWKQDKNGESILICRYERIIRNKGKLKTQESD